MQVSLFRETPRGAEEVVCLMSPLVCPKEKKWLISMSSLAEQTKSITTYRNLNSTNRENEEDITHTS